MCKEINSMTAKEKAGFYNAVASVVDYCKQRADGYGDVVIDQETGEYVRDEEGNYKMIPPKPNDCYYADYIGTVKLAEFLNTL